MSQNTVNCSKYNEELPALESAPFEGELGQEILEKVSQKAWSEWQDDMMIKVINEYRLNMVDPEQYNVLLTQMKTFLGLGEGESLEVENEARGKEG